VTEPNSSKQAMSSDVPLPLARTPLFALGISLNARMTGFSGWEMPVQYSGITHEHQAVRSTAGMFDISHMGKFLLTGDRLVEQLQRLVPSDLSRLQPGQAQYTVLLNAQAGIVDDLIFYYQGLDEAGQQRWFAIVNAATTLKDKTWLLEHLDLSRLTFQDDSTTKILLAVQGPDAVKHLQPLVAEDLAAVPAFGHFEGTVLGQPGFLARTGYTGEDGFEIMVDPAIGLDLWRSLLSAGVTPCGLGARDTLRLEAAMALYGQDIDDTTTPLESGLRLAGASRQQRGFYWAIGAGTAKGSRRTAATRWATDAGTQHCPTRLSGLLCWTACW